jgi:hypothetical protein
MKHVSFCGLRSRAGISVAVAAFCFVIAAGTAGATGTGATVTPGDPFFFAGDFTRPDPVLTPGIVDPVTGAPLGCPSQQANMGLVNCKYFTFVAGATGTATLTIQAEAGDNFIDAAVHCNGEAAARAVASSNAGQPGTITFPVTVGDVCEIRVSIFLAAPGEATPLNRLTFTGSVTLAAAVGAARKDHFEIEGGGKVGGGKFNIDVETDELNEGKVRWFNATGCKSWAQSVTSVNVQPTADGWIATIRGFAKVRENGVTTSNVPFQARAEDHHAPGAKDRFAHNLCGGVDAPIDSGQIEISPED